MRPLGFKLTKTRVAGHQRCGVCHPETKEGRAADKARWRRELERNDVREAPRQAE